MPLPVYKYFSVTSYQNNYQPVSVFSLDAPSLYDNSLGDTTTGYTVSATNNNALIAGLIDLGVSPPSVSYYEATLLAHFGGQNNYTYRLAYSNNGTDWTEVANVTLQTTAPEAASFSTGKTALPQQTARYWQFVLESGSTQFFTLGMTDYRLYDADGNQIGVAATATSSLPNAVLVCFFT